MCSAFKFVRSVHTSGDQCLVMGGIPSRTQTFCIGAKRYNHVFKFSTVMSSSNGETSKRQCTDRPVIGTHSGTFHCDEVLACFMLKQLPEYENAEIFRSRDDEQLRNKCDIILDVGGTFDHDRKLYDHHQKTFQETLSTLRPDLGDEFKIRLSSAGLIYTFYGERILDSILKRHGNVTLSNENLKTTFIQIYRNFIREIDAIDNGVQMFEGGEPLYKISTHISARVGKLNPSWEEENEANIDERFEKAMTYVGAEFIDNVLSIGGSWIKAREYVRKALLSAKTVYKTGEILVLERFCPWKGHLADVEKEHNLVGVPKLIVFQENEKSWRIAGVPVTPDSFLGRKFLPKPWRGLRDNELCEVAGIPNLVFVHHTGFIGGATTKESAMAMAVKSVEWQEEQEEAMTN